MLSNLYLHYVFDAWMAINNPTTRWCRYVNDGLAHCKTLQEAEQLLTELELRFKECGLELHPHKTGIVYCKDDNRKKEYLNEDFNFLGYNFCTRSAKSKDGKMFKSFTLL